MQAVLARVVRGTAVSALQNDLELEMRTIISEEQARKLIATYHGGEVLQSVNIIQSHQGTSEFLSKNLDTNTISKHSKRRIAHGEFGDYKVVLSQEQERNSVDVSKPDLVRFKTRYSVLLDVEDGQVSLDITLSRKSNMRDMPATKELFYVKSLNIDRAPYHLCDMVELELEYVSGNDPVKVMMAAYEMIQLHVSEQDANYAKYMSIVSKLLGIRVRNPTIRQVAGQVIGLTKNMLPIETCKYHITDKADGERALLLITDSQCVQIASKTTIHKAYETENYLADAELVDSTLYIFDVLVFKGESVYKRALEDRLELVPKMVAICSKYITAKVKPMYAIPEGGEEKALKDFVKIKRPYRTDGYILTPNGEYFSKTKPLKIKFAHDLSIDFLAKSVPVKYRSVAPYNTMADPYILFCGINMQKYNIYGLKKISFYNELLPSNHGTYFPIQFVPSINTTAFNWDSGDRKGTGRYHDTVVELTWEKGWKLLRVREDRQIDIRSGRYFGNNFDFAERTFMSMHNPVVLADLYSEDNRYFQRTGVDAYKDVRKYNSIVKSVLIKDTAVPRGTAIDLGSGNGQDMFRYPKYGVTKVLFVDNDTTALEELIHRKGSLESKLNVGIVQANLRNVKATYAAIIAANHVVKTKQLVCNMAVHYLTRTLDEYRAFAWLCGQLLESGGKLLLTFLDADAVNKLGNYEYIENHRIKYKIQLNYNTLGVGSEISLVLPFSNGIMYTETLVSIPTLEAALKVEGIKKHASMLFTEFENDSNRLRGADREFMALYRAMIFVKK